jgi:hypothetical protein
MKALENLAKALTDSGYVEALDSGSFDRGHYVLCRQVPGQEQAWLGVIESILQETESLDVHICRRYLLKDGRMVYGWHLSYTPTKGKSFIAFAKMITHVLAVSQATPARVRPTNKPAGKPVGKKPKVYKGLLARTSKAARKLGLSARPANTEQSGFGKIPPPPDLKIGLRVIQQMDEDGSRRTVTEMPLPHVHSELNIPTPGGRGAAASGKASHLAWTQGRR